jgi:hypothetical protein
MPDVNAALTALAERGYWAHPPFPTSEVFRVELRRAARGRGIRVRTGINGDGYAWACTPDGMPAEEPWRGAAEHARASGVYDDLARDAVSRVSLPGNDG